MLVFSFIISIVINLLTKYPYHTIPGDSPIRTAKKSRLVATLFCGAYSAHLFSLLRKRAHDHELGGPPRPLSPSGFAPNVLLFRIVYTGSNFKKVPKLCLPFCDDSVS